MPTNDQPAASFDRQRHRMEAADPSPVNPGECDYCGQPVLEGKIYCTKRCRVAYGNILARQGKAIIQALKLWRKHRGRKGTPGQGKISFVAARVDAILVEDRHRKQHMQSATKTPPV